MPLAPSNTNVVSNAGASPGSSTTLQARRLAEALSDIRTFLRSTAITRDFFAGYSLMEAVADRLDFIGGEGRELTQGRRQVPTLLAELDILQESAAVALSLASELETLVEEDAADANADPAQVGSTNTFVVGL